MKILLLGTKNEGKVKEYKFLLKSLPIKVLSLKEINFKEDFVEKGKTFEEIAKKKALFFSKKTNLPVLADDGGIEIEALGGEPGPKSRRWPGYRADDKELIEFTLKKLEGVPFWKRKAKLCVVLALKFPEEKKVYLARGEIQGFILKNPSKKIIPGYPFRSLFYIPKFKKVYSEISEKELRKVSHRKKALEKLLPIIKEKFGIIK